VLPRIDNLLNQLAVMKEKIGSAATTVKPPPFLCSDSKMTIVDIIYYQEIQQLEILGAN